MISFFPSCQRSCCDVTACITDQLLDMCSLNKPAFKSHAEAMSVSHVKRHPHCGCTAANAVFIVLHVCSDMLAPRMDIFVCKVSPKQY